VATDEGDAGGAAGRAARRRARHPRHRPARPLQGAEDITQLTQNGPAITQQDLSEVDKQVSDPRFTVDVGKSDGKLRRIVATFRVREGGAVRFALRYRDIDKPVTINAPSGGLPLSQLGKQLQHDFGR
jgi:hypothetical protein